MSNLKDEIVKEIAVKAISFIGGLAVRKVLKHRAFREREIFKGLIDVDFSTPVNSFKGGSKFFDDFMDSGFDIYKYIASTRDIEEIFHCSISLEDYRQINYIYDTILKKRLVQDEDYDLFLLKEGYDSSLGIVTASDDGDITLHFYVDELKNLNKFMDSFLKFLVEESGFYKNSNHLSYDIEPKDSSVEKKESTTHEMYDAVDYSSYSYIGDADRLRRQLYIDSKSRGVRAVIYGPPGSGKTIFSKQFLYMHDLKSFSCNTPPSSPEGYKAFVRLYRPDFILLDDVDRLDPAQLKHYLDIEDLDVNILCTANDLGVFSKAIMRRFTHIFEIQAAPSEEAFEKLVKTKCLEFGVKFNDSVLEKCVKISKRLSVAHINIFLMALKNGFDIDADYGVFKNRAFDSEFYNSLNDLEDDND